LDEQREIFYKRYNKEDPHSSLLFQPHTITLMLMVIAIGTYVAFTRDESVSSEVNIKYGIASVMIMFLIFCSVQLKDGIFFRPHPLIWRIITGIGIIYLSLLVFLLFQSVTDARILLKKLDPSLGVPLPERSYAENCDLYTPNDPKSLFRNLYDAVNDEFMLAHLLGWVGKAILLRDTYICWTLSVLFEILEYTFQHMLPNFAECWWDHLILDILFCNWLGIIIGGFLMKYFQMKTYSWVVSLDKYNWEALNNWKHMFYVVMLITLISLIELNAFFLKYVLWIPPPHPFNVMRLILWWGIGMPGVREFYHWVTDKNCKKFGTMSWLCVALAIVELLICIKFGKGMFPIEHPKEVIYPWTIFITLFFFWAIIYYGLYNKPKNDQSEFIIKESPNSHNITNKKKKN